MSSLTEAEEIAQNIRCLLTTVKGTVFGYREFGMDVRLIDAPINKVQSKIVGEVAKLIAKYEPRCRLKKIEWAQSEALEGRLEPRIFIEVIT